MSDYKPIHSQRYAELEVAILHGLRLRTAWLTDSGQARVEPLTPLNLNTCEQAEYLLALDSQGYHVQIRLDRIRAFQPL